MSSGESEYSNSIKKSLVRSYAETYQDGIPSQKVGSAMAEYLKAQVNYETVYVKEYTGTIRFDTLFREAAKEHHGTFVKLFQQAVVLHNQHIAGTRMPEDGFDWFNNRELCEFKIYAVAQFSFIGKSLAVKKRRLHPIDALDFVYKRLSVPLDKLCFVPDTKLGFLFDYALDALVQSFLERFIRPSMFLGRDPLDFQTVAQVDYASLSQSMNQTKLWSEVFSLYNIGSYIAADSVIDAFAELLPSASVLCESEKASLLFDIFELIPLYIKSWSTAKHRLIISDELAVYFFLDFGIPTFVLGSHDASSSSLALSVERFGWLVTGDFLSFAKFDTSNPNLKSIESALLPKLHEMLVALYVKRRSAPVITGDSGAAVGRVSLDAPETFSDRYLGILHNNVDRCIVTGTSQSDEVLSKPSLIPALSMFRFFEFMAKEFDCHYENGKGSEMKIWRDGSRIYTLGRHGRDPKISSVLIRRVLKRLNIASDEWLLKLSRS